MIVITVSMERVSVVDMSTVKSAVKKRVARKSKKENGDVAKTDKRCVPSIY